MKYSSHAKKFTLVLVLFVALTLPSRVDAVTCASPSFTSSTLADTIGNGEDVEVIDLDEDGDLDFLATTGSSWGPSVDVYFYENDGSANFTRNDITDATLTWANSIDTIDLDEDGDIDLLVGAESAGKIYWFENDGSESFTGAEVASLTDVKDVVAADLDGTGGIDVAAVGYTSDAVYWYSNDGSESFGGGSSIDVLDGAVGIVAGDVDDDGDQDLVASAAVLTTGGTRFYANNGSGSFTENSLSTLNDGEPWIVDVDGDGDKDIFKMRGGHYFYENDGSESFSSTYTNVDPFNSANSLSSVDLDDDGDVDFVVSDYSNGFGWLENDGSETFTANQIYDEGSLYNNVDSGDFNGDGLVDLVGVLLSNNPPVLMLQSCDTTNPSVSTLSPTDGEINVTSTSNLVITFTENVDVETGDIVIKQGGTILETIDVTSGQVTGTGTDTITIDPSVTLEDTTNTGIHVLIDSTAFDDAAGNSYAGITDSTTWNFFLPVTTYKPKRPAAPVLNSVSPKGVVLEENRGIELEMTFSSTIYFKGGAVELYRSDGQLIEEMDVYSDKVIWTRLQNVLLYPETTLIPGESYYINVNPGVFADSYGTTFSGISDKTTWAFSVSFNTPPVQGVEELISVHEESEEVKETEALPEPERLNFGEEVENPVCADLESEHWAYTLISDLIDNSRYPFLNEGGKQKCRMNEEVSREVFVTWLISLKYPDMVSKYLYLTEDQLPFWDLELEDPFTPYIVLAYDLGIINGHPDQSFRGKESINRAGLLKISLQTFDWFYAYDDELQHLQNSGQAAPLGLYSDISSDSEWFYSYLIYASVNGIIEGRTYFDQGFPDKKADMAKPVLYSEAAKIFQLTFR